MLRKQFYSFRPDKRFLIVGFTIVLLFSIQAEVFGQGELLKQGATYQAAGDTSDRAPELYRRLIAQYPGSREAETAQFALGGYYNRKFFILEERDKVQDWDSFNKAEEALYKYVGTYKRGVYSADAYYLLALISLRRGYTDNAIKLWNTMKEVAATDTRVYMSRVTLSTASDEVIRGYCDARSLADTALGAVPKLSFGETVNLLTNWTRANCPDNSSRH